MKKSALYVVLVCLLCTGCGSTLYKLLYNSLGAMLYNSLARYVDPTPEQERVLRLGIERFMQWNRKEELPKYIEVLQGLRERMAAGLTEADFEWLRDRFGGFELDLYNAISDGAAAFLGSLTPDQIDRMERAIDKRLAEVAKESAKSAEDRFKEWERTGVRLMDFLYGDLTQEQKDDIARHSREFEDMGPLRIRMDREREKQFFAMLRDKPNNKIIKDYIYRQIVNPERYYPGYYREPSERRDRRIQAAFLRFDHMVTPEQRAHAVSRIDTLIRALRDLAAE